MQGHHPFAKVGLVSLRLGAAALCVLVVALVVWACLPDLNLSNAPGDGGPDAPPVGSYCGDGVIDPGEECDKGDGGLMGCSSTCKIECDGGYVDPMTRHCYFTKSLAPSNHDAHKACFNLGAHLVSFNGEDEYMRVVASDAGVWPTEAPTWIGLSYDPGALAYIADDRHEPGFPVPSKDTICSGCYAHGVDASAGFPLNGADPFDYVLASPDAAAPWFGVASPPNNGAAVLCEREPPGSYSRSCNGATCFELPSPGNKSYVVGTAAQDPDEARTICESLNDAGRGSLLVIHTPDERDLIAAELGRDLTEGEFRNYWIGLTHDDDAGVWRWDHDTSEAGLPIPWGDQEPEATDIRAYMQLSITTYDAQLLHAVEDAGPFPFICQVTQN
jgi:hypothetical protein